VGLFIHAYVGIGISGMLGIGVYGQVPILIASSAISTIFALLSLKYMKWSSTFPRLVLLWLLWVVMTCVHLLDLGVGKFLVAIIEVTFCPLVFFLFYMGTRQNVDRIHTNRLGFLLLLTFVCYMFFKVYYYRKSSPEYLDPRLIASYYALLLLPWVLLCSGKFTTLAGTSAITVVVLLSMKQTGLLALVLALITYIATLQFCQRGRLKWVRATWWVILPISFFLLFSFLDNQMDGYASDRMSTSYETGGSGRIDIYAEVTQCQIASNAINWFSGHGHGAVCRSIPSLNSAHNDWLEVLFDYGIIGLAIYSALHVVLISRVVRMVLGRSVYGPAMASSYVLFFILSFPSHLIFYPTYFAYLMSFWGSVIAASEKSTACRFPLNWIIGASALGVAAQSSCHSSEGIGECHGSSAQAVL
jgi:O-antigen ligase